MRHLGKAGVALVALLLAGAIILVGLAGPSIAASPIRAAILSRGVAETGAVNLVSSIYLGFRAFDTLGETIVLMLAVSGVVLLVGRKR